MPTVVPIDGSTDAVKELTNLVAQLERTQRSEDVEGFLTLFDRDAVWVTGNGRRLVGLETIGEFTRAVLPGAFADGGSVTYEVEHILFISGDVALTAVRQKYIDAGGSTTGAGLLSYVWRHDGDEWRIVVGQNTTSAETDPPIDTH